MRKVVLYLFLIINFANKANAQYVQLTENVGEIGLFQGLASCKGDISPGLYIFNSSYGGFYKKLLNDYIGMRINYEQINLQGDDNHPSITNSYVRSRKVAFQRAANDFSLMLELYFSKFIAGNRHYRFSPYLSFGVGVFQTTNGRLNNNTNFRLLDSGLTISYPLNLGFKYNVKGPINIFGEASYRFTNTDKIDFFSDEDKIVSGGRIFQGSTSGKDQYFSFKLGVSYNLTKIYGPDKPLNQNKKTIFVGNKSTEKANRIKGLFNIFKRK